MTIHLGGCHCRRVRFEIEAPAALEVTRCSCSICRQCGYLHLIVPRADFRLLSGDDVITTYTFNTGVAKHHFCKVCGVKSYYVPRSHPDGVSVNANCLEPDRIRSVTISPFDGSRWEQNISQLSPLSD